jgi:hypothetical protein
LPQSPHVSGTGRTAVVPCVACQYFCQYPFCQLLPIRTISVGLFIEGARRSGIYSKTIAAALLNHSHRVMHTHLFRHASHPAITERILRSLRRKPRRDFCCPFERYPWLAMNRSVLIAGHHVPRSRPFPGFTRYMAAVQVSTNRRRTGSNVDWVSQSRNTLRYLPLP